MLNQILNNLVASNVDTTELSMLEALLATYLPVIGSALLKILFAFLIWFIGKRLIGWIMKLIEKAMTKRGTEITVARFLKSLIKWCLYILLLFMLVDFLGFPTASLIAALGSAGLAVGLALQGSLANFAGGVLILLLHPFRVGDYVIEKATNNEGTVQKIDIFYTTLLTYDNQMIVIPNGTMANTSIVNVTSEPYRRVDVKVGITYSSNLAKAKEVLLRTLNEYELAQKDRDITVVVSELQSSSVELTCRCWVKTEQYWDALFYLTEAVKLTLDRNEIEIAFNQLDVHLIDK